jgi:GAF domain-containing protein
VINLSHRSRERFTLDDLKPLDSLAANAAVAIQNAQAFSKLKGETDMALSHAAMEHLL